MFGNWRATPRSLLANQHQRRLYLETLEPRNLLATMLTVDVTQPIRIVNDHILGVNASQHTVVLTTPQTEQMVRDAGLRMVRFPGGSGVDQAWHFDQPPARGDDSAAALATFIESVGADGYVTVDYGSGSPQEAAAFFAYFDADIDDPTVLGVGPEWNAGSWQNRDWQTAGFWADLRAAAPLTQDDGLNFLRIGHPAPFGFHYFEVGNEIYNTGETDHHAPAHDPATVVAFAAEFKTLAQQIRSDFEVGIGVSGTQGGRGTRLNNILRQTARQGFQLGFLSDHNYMYGSTLPSDDTLLYHTATDPQAATSFGPINWAGRAQAYRSRLVQYLGGAADGVELLCTEFNSHTQHPDNQYSSLVNGLFVADALGGILQTEYNAALFWDLRNGWSTQNHRDDVYGWRYGGSLGMIGQNTNGVPPPGTGNYVPMPSYMAEQLLSQMVHTGDLVVQAASAKVQLTVYAVLQQNGHLDLLVINKSPNYVFNGDIQISGFQPAPLAQFWQYGETEDTAQSQTSDGSAALTTFTRTLTLSGAQFRYGFPKYSMTVIDLSPDAQSDATPGLPLPPSWLLQPATSFNLADGACSTPIRTPGAAPIVATYPDFFDPAYANNLRGSPQAQVGPTVDDPWNIDSSVHDQPAKQQTREALPTDGAIFDILDVDGAT